MVEVIATVLCLNVGAKTWQAGTDGNEDIATELATLLLAETTPGSKHQVSIVCLQEVNDALASRVGVEYLGPGWEVAHMGHIDLFTAWRTEASRPGQATWEAVAPASARPLWPVDEPGPYRWWRGYLEARGRGRGGSVPGGVLLRGWEGSVKGLFQGRFPSPPLPPRP